MSATETSSRRSARPWSICSRRSRSGTPLCARTRGSSSGCSGSERTRRGPRRRRRSRRCTSAWGSSEADALVTRIAALVAGTAALTAIAGALHYAGGSPTAVFLLAGVALAGLAWLIGTATESVGVRFGHAVTGVLQSTLGNLPELFIVL